MRGAGLVLHVVQKDLAAARWFLAAYFALLVLSAYQQLSTPGGMQMLAGMFAVVTAWLCVGVAVQSDPATRADAFWVTRPLSPSIVFAAKLAMIGVVIAMGLATQLFVMTMHDAPAGDMLAEAGTLVLFMTLMLATALLTGALTSDMAGLLAASLGVIILIQVPELLLPSPGGAETGGAATTIVAVAWIGAVLAAAAWQYRRRNVRVGRVALVALVLGGTTADQLLTTATPHSTATPVEVSGRISGAGPSVGTRHQLRIHGVLAGQTGDAGSTAILVPEAARVVASDGRESVVSMANRSGSFTSHFRPDDARTDAAFPDGVPLAIVDLTEQQYRLLSQPGAMLVVDGTAHVQRALPVAALALDDARVHRAGGIRVRIHQQEAVPGEELAVTVTGATGARRESVYEGDYLTYTLVGAAGDSLPLQRRGSETGRGMLALPSVRGWHRSEKLRAPAGRSAGTNTEPPPAWPLDARLHVYDWRVVDSYPVRISASLAEGAL